MSVLVREREKKLGLGSGLGASKRSASRQETSGLEGGKSNTARNGRGRLEAMEMSIVVPSIANWHCTWDRGRCDEA